ncbi:MAG: hypothetical protein SGI83_11295 [Bacteroidota bacterium]|nr:hypothetical protein [Bacteroidota bacterium]
MEVHAHTHTARKKWTHYFWEFLMLFLAVFCGFLAEYQLEHKIEKDREKVYIKNLYEDLKSDTILYLNYAKINEKFSNNVDTLITLMKGSDRNSRLSKIYFLARTATINSGFLSFNQRTFLQMKNSGQLRLIRNQQVADSISSYYYSLDVMQLQNESIVNRISDYMLIVGELFDAEILFKIWKEIREPPSQNLKLLTTDPIMINKYLTATQYFYGTRNTLRILGLERSEKAKNLIRLIKIKYNLK